MTIRDEQGGGMVRWLTARLEGWLHCFLDLQLG